MIMNISIRQRLTAAKHLQEVFSYVPQPMGLQLDEPLFKTVCTKCHLQYLKDRGECLTITPQLHPKLYALCQEVQRNLNYNRPIDFLLYNASYLGASAFYSPQESQPSIVAIYAGSTMHLIDDELKWLIGHEIGHIINHDTELRCLYDIYCNKLKEILSVNTTHTMHLYDLLCELEADRYGLLACGSEVMAMSAMAKFMSGGVLEQFDLSSFLQTNHDLAELYIKEGLCIGEHHPIYPFRVEALHLYANATSERELQKQLKPIISAIEYFAKHS